ncbi:MAG TPA: hypothetical protein PKI32_08465 [Opitutales bacterium]|nr:hypothetical protein [Opitutales bacterium]
MTERNEKTMAPSATGNPPAENALADTGNKGLGILSGLMFDFLAVGFSGFITLVVPVDAKYRSGISLACIVAALIATCVILAVRGRKKTLIGFVLGALVIPGVTIGLLYGVCDPLFRR